MSRARLGFFYCFAVIFVVVAYFFFSTGGTFHFDGISNPWVPMHQLLADALMHGQTFFLRLPRPELLALPDPYDAFQSIPYKIHDASLYNGKYYSYFGPAPALLFYIPYKLLMGNFPTDWLVAPLFLAGAFAFQLALLLSLVKYYFQKTPLVLLTLLTAVLAFGGFGPYVLARSAFYEVSIASGQFFLWMAVFYFYRILKNPGFRWNNALALLVGCALVLSVASRPNLVFFVIFACAGLLWQRRSIGLQRVLVIVSCVGLGGLLLGIYNWVRFDSFLEFGTNYQLTVINPRQYARFSLARTIPNWIEGSYYYFFRGFQLHGAFPYLDPELGEADTYQQRLQYVREGTVGLLPVTPFLILSLVPLALVLRFKIFWKDREFLRNIFWICGMAFLMVVVPLLLSSAALQRYALDFSGGLILSSCIALLAVDSYLESGTERMRFWRKVWRYLTGVSILVSVLFHLLLGFKGPFDEFSSHNPQQFRSIVQLLPQF
jgi:hypothetical protein